MSMQPDSMLPLLKNQFPHYSIAELEGIVQQLLAGEFLDHTALEIVTVFARSCNDYGLHAKAFDCYVQLLKHHERYDGAQDLKTIAIVHELGRTLCHQGRHGDAKPHFMRVAAAYKQHHGSHHPDTVWSITELAQIYQALKQYGEADHLFADSFNIATHSIGRDAYLTAEILRAWGQSAFDQGAYALAEQRYGEALRIFSKTVGETHPTTLKTLGLLAFVFIQRGTYRQAQKILTELLGLYEYLDTKDELLMVVSRLAFAHFSLGEFDAAEPLYIRAISIAAEVEGEQSRSMAALLYSLACVYGEQQRWIEAEQFCLQALAINEWLFDAPQIDIAVCLGRLAGIYQSQGRIDDAEIFYGLALEMFEQLESQQANRIVMLYNFANFYTNLHNYEQAWPLASQALQLLKTNPQHPLSQTIRDFERAAYKRYQASAAAPSK